MCASSSDLGMPGGSAHVIGRPKLFKAFCRRNQCVGGKKRRSSSKTRSQRAGKPPDRVRGEAKRGFSDLGWIFRPWVAVSAGSSTVGRGRDPRDGGKPRGNGDPAAR